MHVILTCTTHEYITLPISLGVAIKTPSGEMVSKARLLMCAVDLPARASVLNMKQFNGKWGCTYCEDEGVPRPTCHFVRNWPYSTTSTPRTHESIVRNARRALRENDAVSYMIIIIIIVVINLNSCKGDEHQGG